jgi:uncharacterized protein involved in cysteine biosynthesis
MDFPTKQVDLEELIREQKLMNRISNKNKSDFALFLKDLYLIFSLLCVAFTLAYFFARLNNLDTNLHFFPLKEGLF